MSPSGTFRTWAAKLTMSVHGGKADFSVARGEVRVCPSTDLAPLHHVTYLTGQPRAWISYFNPITIESGPTSGSTRVFENPTSRIQA
jgi:hypothetical protein